MNILKKFAPLAFGALAVAGCKDSACPEYVVVDKDKNSIVFREIGIDAPEYMMLFEFDMDFPHSIRYFAELRVGDTLAVDLLPDNLVMPNTKLTPRLGYVQRISKINGEPAIMVVNRRRHKKQINNNMLHNAIVRQK